ncbi:MAG TPA: arginase family protein, partial [Adhaeribacter sp.]|nr:arginase family protein [Adhaeribacter sp.]
MAAKSKLTKEDKIASFDQNGVGDKNAGLFGLPFDEADAEVVIIPVPWEVTVSYSAGTADGPEAVKAASPQLDLFDPEIKDAWKLGIWMEEISEEWKGESSMLRKQTEHYIDWLEAGSPDEPNTDYAKLVKVINKKGAELTKWLKDKSAGYLKAGKLVGVLGGDHSTPLGLLQALGDQHEEFGILHIDAHS